MKFFAPTMIKEIDANLYLRDATNFDRHELKILFCQEAEISSDREWSPRWNLFTVNHI